MIRASPPDAAASKLREPAGGSQDRAHPGARRSRRLRYRIPGEHLPPHPYREDIHVSRAGADVPCRGEVWPLETTTTDGGALNEGRSIRSPRWPGMRRDYSSEESASSELGDAHRGRESVLRRGDHDSRRRVVRAGGRCGRGGAIGFPNWESTPATERADMLHEVANRLRSRTDELAALMTAEGGKPVVENADEVSWVAAAFDYYAEIGRDSAGRVIPPIEPSQLALVVKDALGVVGCIVPWNYPLLLLAWKLAPALAAGNSAVCKPSEVTPLSTLAIGDVFDHMPNGAVNLIAGAGDVGGAISSHEGIDAVAFTGSVETGKKVAAACIDRMARVNLEMGGKDPFIVCSDVAAEIEVAARGGAWAAYLERRAGLHLSGALLRDGGRLRRLRRRLRRPHQLASGGRPDRQSHRHRPDGLCSPAGQGRGAGRGGGVGRRRSADRRRPRRLRPWPLLRADRGHGPRARDGSSSRGDVRARGAHRSRQVARRGDRAGERDPVRPRRERLHARLAEHPALHARDQVGHGLVQRSRSPTTTRARSAASSSPGSAASSAARASRRSRRPSTSTSRRSSGSRTGGTRMRLAPTAPSSGAGRSPKPFGPSGA